MDAFKGSLLRTRRQQVGLSVEQLAVRSGRAYRTLIKLERDEIRPSITTLCLLAEVLRCDVGAFFGPAPTGKGARAVDNGSVSARRSPLGQSVTPTLTAPQRGAQGDIRGDAP
jgi:transcriptional regulator with XRE-family HTH domain